MRNMYAKAYEEMERARDYRENLVENIVDEILDKFEEGLNGYEFSNFNLDGYDREIKLEVYKQISEIFKNTPYFLFTGAKGRVPLRFLLRNDRKDADYFNYLMFLKDKYDSEDNSKCKNIDKDDFEFVKVDTNDDDFEFVFDRENSGSEFRLEPIFIDNDNDRLRQRKEFSTPFKPTNRGYTRLKVKPQQHSYR